MYQCREESLSIYEQEVKSDNLSDTISDTLNDFQSLQMKKRENIF